MIVLNAYFDESGKQNQERFVTFAGFVSESWDDFNRVWGNRLRKYKLDGGLHLSESDMQANAQKLEMYSEFIKVIRLYVEKGIAIAADTGGFQAIHQDIREYLYDDAHFIAVESALIDLKDFSSATPDVSVNVICDDDPLKACSMYKLYNRFLQTHTKARKMFRSIAFADDKFYPQLQAADLLAWVGRAEARHRFYNEDFPLRRLYHEFCRQDPNDILEFESGVWTREKLANLKPIKKRLRSHAKMKP